MYCSFRPLSGNYISQWFGRLTVLCEDGRFPSPVGELHFSIGCAGVYSDKKRVSVPCRGTTFLNLFPYRVSKSKTGFRPLSGNYISQYIPATVNIDQKSFRPLSGNYISQWKSQILLIMASFVSVPCRGTTFLNSAEGYDYHRRWIVSVPCRGTTFLNTIPTIPPPVWAHGRDCVGKIFLEK